MFKKSVRKGAVIGAILFISFLLILLFTHHSGWTVYNTSNSDLPDNYVTALAIDALENKWIGTCNGFAKFDGRNWRAYALNFGLPFEDVNALAIDGSNLWIGNGPYWGKGGLVKIDWTNCTYGRKNCTAYTYNTSNSGLPDNDIQALAIDNNNNIWIGTDKGGLAKFDGVNWWTVYDTTNSGLPDNDVQALVVDESNIWIGTYEGGLAKFDGTNWTVYDTTNSGLPDDDITALAIDYNNNIWIGTRQRGLVKFDGSSWTVYNIGNSGLPDDDIRALAIDYNNNIWIGTQDGGLAVFDGTNWTVYNTSNSGLPSNWVNALAIEGSNIWIGTDGGLAVYNTE